MNKWDYELSQSISFEKHTAKWDMPYTHSHAAYEIYALESGSISVLCGNNLYRLSQGDVMLYTSNSPHRARGGKEHSRWTLTFLPSFLNEYFAPQATEKMLSIFNNAPLHIPPQHFHAFLSLLRAYLNAKNSDRFQILPYILYFIKINGVKCEEILTENKTVASAIDYISANFLTLSGVEAVAENAFVTKEYLCSAFKRETGFTITKYINNLKLNYACHLLLTSDKSIAEIATESGFNSITYFGRIFKEEIKTTPLQYRKTKTAPTT